MNQNQKAINEAANALHNILFRERIQSDQIVKYGKSTRGRQRYIDLESGKTFSDSDQSYGIRRRHMPSGIPTSNTCFTDSH